MIAGNDLGRQVVTVRGPVRPDELGVVLSHDHILVDAYEVFGAVDYRWIIDDVELAIDEVGRFGGVGGGTICDPTNVGLGRDPVSLRRISEATAVHVVMGSGWYREKVYPAYVAEELPDRLAEGLVSELTEGVDGTGIRPGFIGEIGTERRGISPAQERVFRAAARAHRQTGCPIVTHTTHFGELAIEQLDLLKEEGVAPRSVVVSHLGDRIGPAAIRPIAERGAWLSVDNLGFSAGYAPLEVRADNVAALCEEGFGGQVLLGNDICQRDQLEAYGGPGYANVIRNFLPLLRARGVSEDQIHGMTIDNPAQAFAYEAEAARVRWRARRDKK